MNEIVVDRETINSIRHNFDTKIRLHELKESIDHIIGRDIFNNWSNWKDEDIAKLDYILCEIENTVIENRNVKITIKD